jgi:uncharacterized membrane protein YeaQ/YmgE (transglycosylase-associated protein family)
MTPKAIILTVVIGVVAGWLTRRIMVGSSQGFLGDVVVGIAGAFLGAWIFHRLGIGAYGLVGSLLLAVVGRLLVLVVVQKVRRA